MKVTITIIVISILLLTGCTNSTFNKSMDEGKLAIVNNDYEKAEGMFSLAIEEKENNNEANSLLDQTKKLREVINLKEEKKFEKALKLCEEISQIESESDVVKKEVDKLKEVINKNFEDIKKEKNNINKEISNIETLISNGDYNNAKAKLETLNDNIGKNDNFKEELDKINNLMTNCNDKIKKIEEENKKKKEQQSGIISESKAISLVKYMLSSGDYMPSIIEVSHIEGNNYVVHAYDIIQNQGEPSHTATTGWYYVNMYTGKVDNMF